MCSPARGHPYSYTYLSYAFSPVGRNDTCYSTSLSPLVAWYYLKMLSNMWLFEENGRTCGKQGSFLSPISEHTIPHRTFQEQFPVCPSSCLDEKPYLMRGLSGESLMCFLVGSSDSVFTSYTSPLESWAFSHILSSADLSLPHS